MLLQSFSSAEGERATSLGKAAAAAGRAGAGGESGGPEEEEEEGEEELNPTIYGMIL